MRLNSTKERTEAGDISIFTALIMVTIMLSGAIALGVILSQQIPSTFELLHSEQAFYAASSGTEQAFYEIIHNGATDDDGVPGILIEPGDETIHYDGGDALYYGQIVALQNCPAPGDPDFRESCRNGAPCGVITGSARGINRRLARGAPETECPDTLLVGQ